MNDDLVKRLTAYLAGGGLWNPELANHFAVRDLIIDCRDALEAAGKQHDELMRTWFVLKDFNAHPGRTDDQLSDCVRKALEAAGKQQKPVAWELHAPNGGIEVTNDKADMLYAVQRGDYIVNPLVYAAPPAVQGEPVLNGMERAFSSEAMSRRDERQRLPAAPPADDKTEQIERLKAHMRTDPR